MRFDPNGYEDQLADKSKKVEQLFAQFEPPQLQVFSSPKLHFRMRAEFRIWHDKDNAEDSNTCYYAMFEKSAPRDPIRIDYFPIAHQSITELMPRLLQQLNNEPLLKRKLFQVEFLTTQKSDLLITLIYHRPLDDAWQAIARALAEELDVQIIGRSRKQRLVLTHDTVCETLQVDGSDYLSLQGENTFTQPNVFANQHMINWIATYLKKNQSVAVDKSLLEMYCGNGNFTIPLAKYFKSVLATEISKTSTKLAQQGCELNHVDNIEFVRLSGEETSEALSRQRAFRRLAHIDLDSFDFSAVLVDPPRAGLDQRTEAFVAQFDTIFYISCNPQTLANNLEALGKTHRIADFALFDQFPYTDHCECGAILVRNDDSSKKMRTLI